MAVKQAGNANLHKARKARLDEFYTRIEDVEAELWHYREHFRGKTVYLNCDDPRWSAFWRYFCLRFGEQARELLARRQATEAKIAALRAELKRETQFNRKVEINMEIKRLERERTGSWEKL